jgi:lipopolysaccharide/colanic/teichoic acid biosynthesis glycosyltransferase
MPVEGLDVEHFITEVRRWSGKADLPVILSADHWTAASRIRARRAGATECVCGPVALHSLNEELYPVLQSCSGGGVAAHARPMPRGKRLLDLLISLPVLFLLSPVLMFIALQIKITSRGPVLLRCKRLGTGYRIFNLYRFRTRPLMTADKGPRPLHLNSCEHLFNTRCAACIRAQRACSPLYVDMGDVVCENELRLRKKAIEVDSELENGRTTALGRFLERTHLDGLPQLLNVVTGDLSLVGNRPLPPDEAESLSPDEWRGRFLAPAGLTGMWRLADQHDHAMPEIVYSESRSLGRDLFILWRSLPSLLLLP